MSDQQYGRSFPISELLNVKDFLAKWKNDVYQLCASKSEDRRAEIGKRMNVNEEISAELESVCSLDHMKAGDDMTETDKWKLLEVIPEETDLMALKHQKMELQKRKNDQTYYSNVIRKLKYKREDFVTIPVPEVESEIPDEYKVIYPDVIVEAIVHRPARIRDLMKKDSAYTKSQVLFQFGSIQLLGRQKLTDLRDIIRCVHDLTVAGDLSENPDLENQVYAKDIFKSAFFYINGVFYNDMREADSIDYSEPIIEWSKKRGIDHYETKNMEDFTLLDLNLRLGEPYLYFHQGDCEHVIIFSDIRLLEITDIQDTREYPHLLRKYRRHRTLCRSCCAQSSRWITFDSPYAPENPCYFCDVCYKALHYDENNKKIGDFQAYKYFDTHAIM